MPQTIRSFLQTRRGSTDIDEVRKALDGLPLETPVYQYQSIAQMEDTAHSLNHDGREREHEFCIFTDAPRDFFDGDGRKDRRFGIIKLHPDINILVLKVPIRMHCVAARRLDLSIVDKIREMGMNPDTDLHTTGSTTFQDKEADSSYIPQQLPAGRASNWPSMVLEIGWTELQTARQWIEGSGGLVQLVITVKIARTQLMITKYVRRRNGHTRAVQVITIKKQQN